MTGATAAATDAGTEVAAPVAELEGPPWQRLDTRVIWLDGLKALLSLVPTGVAVGFFDMQITSFVLWPVVLTTVLGLSSAIADLARWLKTRYRVTDRRVELRTGFVVLSYRAVPRERIRSVDTSARFSQRLAGLRVVSISSGQQSAKGQPAFLLDAVSAGVAERLRVDLLRRGAGPAPGTGVQELAPGEQVIARLRWRWLLYNLVNSWALLAAVMLLWGAYWLAGTFNVDLLAMARKVVDDNPWGPAATIAAGAAVVLLIGVAGLVGGFITENWDFRLSRRVTDGGTALYTRNGLFRSREVYRDDARVRGIHLGEPLFWRWMGATDTQVISTGLSVVAVTEEPASTILPRCSWPEARHVAVAVLQDATPLDAPLSAHPRAALRRRLVWAAVVAGGIGVVTAWLGATTAVVPDLAWLAAAVLLPVLGGAAVIAYRALGHAATDGYLVFRAGLFSRSTTVLKSSAVVAWTVRQSVLQRRLGLATVQVATAAGFGMYAAPDLATDDSVALIASAGPAGLGDLLEYDAGPDPE